MFDLENVGKADLKGNVTSGEKVLIGKNIGVLNASDNRAGEASQVVGDGQNVAARTGLQAFIRETRVQVAAAVIAALAGALFTWLVS